MLIDNPIEVAADYGQHTTWIPNMARNIGPKLLPLASDASEVAVLLAMERRCVTCLKIHDHNLQRPLWANQAQTGYPATMYFRPLMAMELVQQLLTNHYTYACPLRCAV